jgi:hypothetical protein
MGLWYVVDGSLETGIEVVKKDETIFITETEIINLKSQDSDTRFILIETVM